MKVFRAILTILGCALIVLGGYSAVTFLMQRDFAPVQEPTVEAPQPAEPEQPEETPEEPTQPAEVIKLYTFSNLLKWPPIDIPPNADSISPCV